jgi:hypothetical protein
MSHPCCSVCCMRSIGVDEFQSSGPEAADAVLGGLLVRARAAAGLVVLAEVELVKVCGEVLTHIAEYGLGWGFRSEVHQLSFELGLTRRQASRVVTVAQALPKLPNIRNLFYCGEINLTVAEILVRVATPENEVELVELAQTATVSQLTKICGAYKNTEEPEEKPEPFLSLNQTDQIDNSWTLRGQLSGLDGAVLQKALQAKRDELFHLTGKPVSNVEALRAILDDGLGENSLAERYTVLINLDAEKYQNSGGNDGVSILNGPHLSKEETDTVLEDCSTIAVINRNGRPVWASHKTRTAPAWMKRLLRSQDNGCIVPGCTASGYLEAHHLIPYAQRPTTDMAHMGLICNFHHTQLHKDDVTITRTNNGQIIVKDRHGKQILHQNREGPTIQELGATAIQLRRKLRLKPQPAYQPLTNQTLDNAVSNICEPQNQQTATATGQSSVL